MAKRTKSALKANRQNVKRRQHNRELRSKLRTALNGTVSIVDKMATKGIIHRNTAGRYKSRLTSRLAKASA